MVGGYYCNRESALYYFPSRWRCAKVRRRSCQLRVCQVNKVVEECLEKLGLLFARGSNATELARLIMVEYS